MHCPALGAFEILVIAEARDDDCRLQLAQRRAQAHRGDDAPAGRIDDDDVTQIRRIGDRLQKLDERLRRVLLDNSIRDDDARAAAAAIARLELGEAKTHRLALRQRRRGSCEEPDADQDQSKKERRPPDFAASPCVHTSKWWAVTGSNRRPSRCKRDALPTELTARGAKYVPRDARAYTGARAAQAISLDVSAKRGRPSRAARFHL